MSLFKLNTILCVFLGLGTGIFLGCGVSLPDEVEQASKHLPDRLSYNYHIKPILSDRCFNCHGNDQASLKAGLRLDLQESAYGRLPDHPNKRAIVPGRLRSSEVIHRILSDSPDYQMPPPDSKLSLSPLEKATLAAWIEQGAEYEPHWSFNKPTKPEIPGPVQAGSKNAIDHFIISRAGGHGLNLSEEADRETLLRRVSFDLTGLPPSTEDIDQFLQDDHPDAYEKVVDRLLASSAYGERLATEWMDVARFADTHGYTVDRYRDMSPWRDWVIQAFNENMPFDSFAIWQLAGDLLPNATKKQKLATGFNRNHQQNMEGGIVDEEFRVEYVADRTNTLGTAFLGLTLECARCHDHKYDPISQKAYYELFSFFNNVNEAGQISWDDAMPTPTLPLIDTITQNRLDLITQQIHSKEAELLQISEKEATKIQSWIKKHPEGIKNDTRDMIAHFPLDGKLVNSVNSSQSGEMRQVSTVGLKPVFDAGYRGKGLQLDGDAWLDLGGIGAFDKATPFTIALHVNLPSSLEDGVIFHKGVGAALYNYRGFHLAIKENRLELLMAHTYPDNAIIEYGPDLPRDEWIQLVMTYDGSGRADGLKAYLNSSEITTDVKVDNLYKDIIFYDSGAQQPGIQIGARWRGIGIKGAKVDEVKVFSRELTALEISGFIEDRSIAPAVPNEDIKKTYLNQYSKPYIQALRSLEQLRRTRFQIEDTLREVMVMREMEEPRQAYVLERGQYQAYGEPVSAQVLDNLFPLPETYARNRLGLAQWLFHPDHPLTSRVIVNRYWQMIFGEGLVSTPEDFGSQGALPSHPELLDWLAIYFIESSWDVKGLIKLMVMSGTYRQSSQVSPEYYESDPNNIWYARGPTNRLTAEMMRDQALAASDLLEDRIGGPSVKPHQPDGLWRMNGGQYRREAKDFVHRRSLYTFLKRSVPHPTQQIFDGPSRSLCTVRRQKTNTPLQALVLLNDPVYLEAASAIGHIMNKTNEVKQGIEIAFRRLTGRLPSLDELEILTSLFHSELQNFQLHPYKSKSWLTAGDVSQPSEQSDHARLAANIVVASTIMNSDASTFKR